MPRPALLLLLALLLVSCGDDRSSSPHGPLTIYAAASTTPVLREILAGLPEIDHRGVTCQFAASSALARQIENGADADILLSASTPWMDWAEEHELIDPATRRDLFTNELVLAVPRGVEVEVVLEPGFDFGRAVPGRIVIGDPDHVPVGTYARESLEALGWWEEVQPRLVTAGDARAALRLVEIGEVDAGILYASDAQTSPHVVVIATFGPEHHNPIRYPVAVVRDADPAAAELLQALIDACTAERLEPMGFGVPGD